MKCFISAQVGRCGRRIGGQVSFGYFWLYFVAFSMFKEVSQGDGFP